MLRTNPNDFEPKTPCYYLKTLEGTLINSPPKLLRAIQSHTKREAQGAPKNHTPTPSRNTGISTSISSPLAARWSG
ncbi:hypothetical protein MCEMSE15_02145 [Fimbriimonadaceae bacterium]